MMFLKYIFFLIIISCTDAEPLLRTLYGSQIQVTACSVSGASCDGVVLLADWVAVLDSCIRAQNTVDIYVQKGIVNCTQEKIKTTPTVGPKRDSSVRSVEARFSHPLVPGVDLALLRLDWPYKDELGNSTLSFSKLNILDRWMESILYPVSKEPTHMDHTESYHQIEYRMYSSPIKMFLATVILPSVLFILLFLFIVFCTGTTDDPRSISYKTLDNKGSSQV